MTREELYAKAFQNETVYRPIQEKDSVLLEVETGCSWHRCRFCDFGRDRFEILPFEAVEKSARILSQLGVDGERAFLLGENPFVIETQQLLKIFALIKRSFSSVREISMYARADDVLRKTPEELRALKEQGLCDLHIGVESGSDTILLLMDKGETAAQLLEAFTRLDEAGIGYHITLILGLGGKTLWKAGAIETSRLLSKIHPKTIWCLALHLFEGTPLKKEADRGDFVPLSPREMLLEERALLENLTVGDCYFMDTTAMGKYSLAGELPAAKKSLLGTINQLLLEGDLPIIELPSSEFLS